MYSICMYRKNGSIGKEKYYTGLDEITEVYENTSTETDELEKKMQLNDFRTE